MKSSELRQHMIDKLKVGAEHVPDQMIAAMFHIPAIPDIPGNWKECEEPISGMITCRLNSVSRTHL